MAKMSKSKTDEDKKKKRRSKSSKSNKNKSSMKKGASSRKKNSNKKLNRNTESQIVQEELVTEEAGELEAEEQVDLVQEEQEEPVEQTEETDVEVKLYEPDAEASDVSDAPNQDTEESESEEATGDSVEADQEQEPEESEPEEESEEETETSEESEPEEEFDESKQEEDGFPDEEEPVSGKKHTGLKVIGVMILLMIYCGAAICGFFAIDRYIVDPDTFPKGTTINSVDVSGMTKDEAKQALTDEWNKHTLSIFGTSGGEIGEIDNFDFEYKIDKQLEHALSPGAEVALMRYFKKDKKDIPVTMTPAGNTSSFKKQFEDLSIVKEAKGDKPSKNAYIDKSDTEFRIVKEVIGNSVDTKKLREAMFKSIADGDEVFNYRRSDYHKAPDIVSTSESLLEERKYCIKYLSFKIRLRNPVDDYTITPDWLDKMIKVSNSGKVTVNDEQVNQFISDTLYPKFSSVGGTRKLKSCGGGTYTISGGTYGYTVDVEKEHKVLTSELKKREDVEREPYYSGKTPDKNWKNDIGNDFVEVSIKKQNVWVVRNGKVIVDTPVVTGVLPRHSTPTGVYYIVYKATNTTLKGRNDDGSKYESHVAYWMPFYLGFGLHDANWRGVFGGTIYVYNGSHGCVNCPPSIMPKIFSNCYEGMPVIVH